MKLNKKILSLLLVMTIVLSVSLVSSASGASADNVTIIIPVASGTMTGTASFNCSLAEGYEAENWTRVRASLQSSSLTANTTETAFTSYVLNNTPYQFNGTIVSSIVEDGNDYTFKCQLWNGTTSINKTRSGIIINNTVPNIPTSLTPTSVTQTTITNAISFSGTVGGVNTTSCTLFFDGTNPGSSSYTMTHSGNNCSYTFSSGVSPQSYRWYIRASDESDTTDSSIKTTSITKQSRSTGTVQQAINQLDLTVDSSGQIVPKDEKSPIGIILIVVVVVIIVVIVVRKG